MFKWILLLGFALAVYWWIRSKNQGKKVAQKPSDSGFKDKQTEVQKMVACAHCALHLPQKESIAFDGRYYCCQEHQQQISPKGWLGKALWRTSPNFDDRPTNTAIDLVVIHHISLPPGEFGGRWVMDFFQNQLDRTKHPYFAAIAEQKVSAHFFIDRAGRLIQLVSIEQRAWHAGKSDFFGRTQCNDFSIGIEIEGDGHTEFAEIQYQTLADLTKVLLKHNPNLKFVGHSDIAPERKTDPGIFFDWQCFQKNSALSDHQLPFGSRSR